MMSVSYKRLWKLLIDRDLKKKELAEKANLSNYTINKLNRGYNVTTDTLVLSLIVHLTTLWKSFQMSMGDFGFSDEIFDT